VRAYAKAIHRDAKGLPGFEGRERYRRRNLLIDPKQISPPIGRRVELPSRVGSPEIARTKHRCRVPSVQRRRAAADRNLPKQVAFGCSAIHRARAGVRSVRSHPTHSSGKSRGSRVVTRRHSSTAVPLSRAGAARGCEIETGSGGPFACARPLVGTCIGTLRRRRERNGCLRRGSLPPRVISPVTPRSRPRRLTGHQHLAFG
jgi:hypothetical protein